MDWLTPILLIQLAFTPWKTDKILVDSNEVIIGYPENMVTMDITAGVILWDTLSIEGQAAVSTESIFNGSSVFSPFQADFYFRTYLTKWGLIVGYEHLCRHPMYPGLYTSPSFSGGHDKFYLEYEYKK